MRTKADKEIFREVAAALKSRFNCRGVATLISSSCLFRLDGAFLSIIGTKLVQFKHIHPYSVNKQMGE